MVLPDGRAVEGGGKGGSGVAYDSYFPTFIC